MTDLYPCLDNPKSKYFGQCILLVYNKSGLIQMGGYFFYCSSTLVVQSSQYKIVYEKNGLLCAATIWSLI